MSYSKPSIYGAVNNSGKIVASNRFMGGGTCCYCTGVGTSRT